MDAKVDVEKNCVYLKLLWERRTREEGEDLAAKIEANKSWDEIVAFADNAIWKSIKNQHAQHMIEIPDPASGYKAYEPICLKVVTGDNYLDNTVLFQHLLTYEWKIAITRDRHDWTWYDPRAWFGPPRLTKPLSPRTTQPQVFQYSPLPGKLMPMVTIRGSLNDPIPVERESSIPIEESADFAWQRAFTATEIFAFGLASIAAIAIGLTMFYANKTTFGSFSDYLAIMVWGFGVDQTKAAVLNYYGLPKS